MNVIRRALPDLLIVISLFLLPLAFFWQVTLGTKTLLPADNLYQYPPWAGYRAQVGVPDVPHNQLLSDLVLENYEWKQFTRQSIAAREIPLWNPYLFAGTPFLAEGQHSALYPFSLIYYVLPLDRAYGWFTVSQLWLAGALMYLFMRGLCVGDSAVRRVGALFAAIVYQMSTFFIASVVFQMIIAAAAWLPLILLMIEFVIQQRALFGRPTVLPWIAIGAVSLGMCILAGHVEFLYYTLLVMAFWAVLRLIGKAWPIARLTRHSGAELGRTALALIALVVIGAGIGAVQFVPLLELASHNFREGSQSFETVRGYALPARHALEFLMPNLYGSPAQHTYIDQFSGGLHVTPFSWQRIDGNATTTITDTYWEVNKNYVEGACYVGLLTLIFAAIALIDALRNRANPRRSLTALLALLSLIALAFAFGTPLYALLYYGLPGVNQLHSPFRWVWPLTFALAAFAGFGADILARARDVQLSTKTVNSARLRWVGRLSAAVLISGGLVLAVLALSRLSFAIHQTGWLSALYDRVAGVKAQFPNIETFYSVEAPAVLLFGLFLILSGAVLWLSRRPWMLPRLHIPVWEAAAIVVIALDLIVATAGFNPAADPAWLKFTPPAIVWLQAHDPQNWRFITVDSGVTGQKPMNANIGWLYGLQDAGGYDSIISKQYVEFMGHMTPQNMLLYNRIAPLAKDQLAALDTLRKASIRYLVSDVALPSGNADLTQVFADQGTFIYEVANAYPRAYVLDGTSGIQAQPISESHGNEVIIAATVSATTAQADGKSTLVLADSYFNGWRAYVKPQGSPDSAEIEVPITLYNGNFRAIELDSGAWTVRFRYSPQSVQIGAFASFIAAVLTLFMLLIWLWRRFYGSTANSVSGVQLVAKNSLAPVVLSLFNRAIDFGFALVMLRVLSLAEAGTFGFVVVILGWFDILTNFGLNTFLTREVARTPSAAALYLRRTSLIRLALILAWLPVLIGVLAIEQRFNPHPLNAAGLLTLGLLYASLIPSSLNNGLSALFYALEKNEIPAAISTSTAIVSVTLRLGALLAGFGIVGLGGAALVINLFTLAMLIWQAIPLLRATQKRDALPDAPVPYRTMLAESRPLMINHLLATMFFKVDVTLLEVSKGPDVVGLYNSAYKWIDAIGVIPSFFTMALLPTLSRQAQTDRPGLLRNYQLAVKMLVILALPIAVITTFLAPTLMIILGGARYATDGARALQLMIWFIPIGWINSLTQYVLIALNLQRPLKWPFIAGVLFNVIANLLFIPLYSYQAASVITILSEVVLQIGFYVLLRRALGAIPWMTMLARPVIAAAVMFGVLVVLWPIAPPFGSLFGLIAAGLTYPAVLMVLRPLDQIEIERLTPLLPAPLRRFART